MDSSNTGHNPKKGPESITTRSQPWKSSNLKVDIVIDLQYGSTGKGLICGFLGNTENYDTVVSANMPNAGHTYIDKKGNKYIFKVLPSSAVGKGVRQIMIGPGAVFDIRRLQEEMAYLRSDQTLCIHPNAVLLDERHTTEERKRLTHIASTAQGSAAAMVDKIWRSGKAPVASTILKGSQFEKHVCTHLEWRLRLDAADSILAEGSQGYSLGINTQFYPYTTSRDCTPAAFLSAMGIPLSMLRSVIGTCRTLPIRVGGPSGDHYPDQEELSWSQLGLPEERTTVTNRVRRIFTYSKLQIEEAVWACDPDKVFLNFANYVSDDHLHRILDHIDSITDVSWIGYGPRHLDVGVLV